MSAWRDRQWLPSNLTHMGTSWYAAASMQDGWVLGAHAHAHAHAVTHLHAHSWVGLQHVAVPPLVHVRFRQLRAAGTEARPHDQDSHHPPASGFLFGR